VHPIWDPSDVSYLLANNKRWVHNKTQEDPDFFKRQALGHHPEYLFIGCSDARLSVQNMLGLEVQLDARYNVLHNYVMSAKRRFESGCAVPIVVVRVSSYNVPARY
jgi:hypothetical protein